MRTLFGVGLFTLILTTPAHAACCYFSARNADVLQPSQKVFIAWDPDRSIETFIIREAPADDIKNLRQLAGHLQEDWFITKFRKIFCRNEMNDDLFIVPARYKDAEDRSEYVEILPTSPP